MSFIKEALVQLKKDLNKNNKVKSKMEFGATYTISETPVIKEVRNKDYVFYGIDNLYPDKLDEVTSGSPIHNAIVKTKAMMTSGDGFLINGANNEQESKANYAALAPEVKTEYDAFLKNELDPDDLKTVIEKMSYDLHRYGAIAYELVWDLMFTRVVRVKYVSVKKIRRGKYKEGIIKTNFYSRDWAKINQEEYKPKELYAFDTTDKTHTSQIVYEKLGDLEYYGEPPYKDCLQWIQTDAQQATYYLAFLENGMNPGMYIRFYEKFANENDKQETLDAIRWGYKGPKNTNRTIYSNVDDKNLSPDIIPIQTKNLDQVQINVSELCDKKILTGHQLTSPLLVGISVSGQLGGNVELEKAYRIFDNVVMASCRRKISSSLKRNVININKIGLTDWEINPFDPFKGYVEAGEVTNDPDQPIVSVQQQAQANLRGSVGGVQGILEIQASVSQGLTDYEAAITMLNEIFGFDDIIARKILGTPRVTAPPAKIT